MGLKENIEQIGKLENGLNVYDFNFIGDNRPQTGLMADEVMQVHPSAVRMDSDGYYSVNYAEAVK